MYEEIILRLPDPSAKKELIDYLQEESFDKEDFYALIEALKDPNKRDSANEIFLICIEKDLFPTEDLQLLFAHLNDPNIGTVTRKILLVSLQKNRRWHEKIKDLFDIFENLHDPDFVNWATDILMNRFYDDYSTYETEEALVKALKNPERQEIADRLLEIHTAINTRFGEDLLCADALLELADELTDPVASSYAKKFLKIAYGSYFLNGLQEKLMDLFCNPASSSDVTDILLTRRTPVYIDEKTQILLVTLLTSQNQLIAANAKKLLLLQQGGQCDRAFIMLMNSTAPAAKEIVQEYVSF